jgi:hypothetical protein
LKESLGKDTESKIEATKEFAKSGAEFYKQIKALYDMTSVPTTVQYNESQAEQDDPLLQQQRRELEKMNGDRSALLASIADFTDKNRKIQTQVLELNGAKDALLKAGIQNDQEIAFWQHTAMRLRLEMYANLYREASILKRTIFYSTGKYPDISDDILAFADEAFASGLTTVDSQIPEQVSPEWVEKKFKKSANQASTAIQALVDAAENESKRARDLRTPQASYLDTTTISIASKESSLDHQFILALNQEIKDQIAAPERSSHPMLLEVPLRIQDAVLRLPERFVDVIVTSVVVKEPNALEGKHLNFGVFNPGFGTVVSGPNCFNIDMRVIDAENRFIEYTTVPPVEHKWDEKIHANADIQKVQERFFYARPPLHAPYYLYVQVGGSPDHNNWKSVPVITSLQITLVGVQ